MSQIENLEDLIGNKTKLMICFILKDRSLSLREINEIFKKKYKNVKRRETIYRNLESMLKSGLLEKTYQKDSKKLVYQLKVHKVLIDFVGNKIILSNENNES